MDNASQMTQRPKAVLAYSGGLDTSVLVRILTDEYGFDVVACHVDVGEARDPVALEDKARRAGAVAFEFVAGQERLARDYILPALQANALYEGVYPLNSALSRPLIAEVLVEVAGRHGATVIAHGATGKGNDQVRFDLAVRALRPDLRIVAPQREKNLTRDTCIQYASQHGIPVPATAQSPYSIDENLWGRSIEGGPLEEPDVEPPEEVFAWTRGPAAAPAEPRRLRIGFCSGVPVSVDGQALDLVPLIRRVGEVAGEHGVGRIDLMESRVVGIKSREVYEAPAAIALITARKDLERFTLPSDLLRVKDGLDRLYAQVVYEGLWFSPLKACLDAFMERAAEPVTGEVTLRLYKGSCQVVGRSSPAGVYNKALSTYGAEDRFDHRAAEGFIQLFGLQLVTYRRLHPLVGQKH
ncbi:MAG: argininosuccinate synthase [Myxococcales bacterium]|nr:argininosuccinate synthase [Myxococcota bacterium]MDW8281414.1 argininosuccinate synthase [Myxococcales bacterium]